MKNFDIGKELVSIVTSSVTLSQALTEGETLKVFPLIAEAETGFPFIVYRKSGYRPTFLSKDGNTESVSCELSIVSETYQSGLTIAKELADILDNEYESEMVWDANVTDASENWFNDAYIQHLRVEFTLN